MILKERLRLLAAISLIGFLAVALRLGWLQIIQHAALAKIAAAQHTVIIDLPAVRGDIYDRNGNVLATTIDSYSVFTTSGGHFRYLKKKLSLAEAQKLQATDPQTISIIKDKKRVYPLNAFAAQLIGFVSSDNSGLAGIELAYDEYLAGRRGEVVTEGDPQGRELYGAMREIKPAEAGMNVTLTLDQNIQYRAEKAISEQIKRSGASSGTILVMDAQTGEILALASKPDFNPNSYQQANSRLWHPRFLDPYEPGSTFKVITVASGLEEKVIDPETKLKALDKIEIGGKVIENSHQIKWPGSTISLSYALEQSINTALVQIGQKLGPERFYNRIRAFRFGERTGCGLAGESKGILRRWQNWSKPDVGMLAFGQGLSVTPLQLICAVSALANQGQLVKPHLVKKIESTDGRFIKLFTREERGTALSPPTVKEMKKLLHNVVQRGSGRRAQMAWFTVGGKTGTAQKAQGGRYLKGRYVASFIGLAPLREPALITLVIVDEPKGSIWGESVCGPVFKDVTEYALRYLNAKPDVL